MEIKTDQVKSEFRRLALTTAEILNPKLYPAQLGGLTHGYDASIEKVLKDAETIYAWLIKDL